MPSEKLMSRFPRKMANLKAAISQLPHILIFDNDDLRAPFRRVAVFEKGRWEWSAEPIPLWLRDLMK